MELKKNMENKFTVWTNVMWFCLGVGAVILFAIATTPAHAQAATLYNSGSGTTTGNLSSSNYQYIGTGYNGAISNIYIYGDRRVSDGTNIRVDIFRCPTYDSNASSLTGCTGSDLDLDSSLFSSYTNPNGIGYQYKITGALLASEWGQEIILLPDYHYYVSYNFASSTVNHIYTNYDSSFGWLDNEDNQADLSLAIEGTGFFGGSYIYNKSPIGAYGTNTLDIGYYYNLAPSENVVSMELRLISSTNGTVMVDIPFVSNTGSTTLTMYAPGDSYNAQIWFTNNLGYEYTCAGCNWSFTVVGGIVNDVLLFGTSTLQDLVNQGGLGTTTMGSQYECGNFLEGNFDLGSCIGSMITNLFAIAEDALYDPFKKVFNFLKALPIFAPIVNFSEYISFVGENYTATTSEDNLTFAYNQMNASNSVVVQWDDVSNLSIVQYMRDTVGWLIYLVIFLFMGLFVINMFKN